MCEIVDGKETTHYCYDTALECEYFICPTAAIRKVNLSMTWRFITSLMCIFHFIPAKCIW